jgi:hypothetical protein
MHDWGSGVIAALMAAVMIHSVSTGDGPTPTDCVGWWHQCIPGHDDNGTKPHGCFDVGGMLVAPLPCTPPLPPGPAIEQSDYTSEPLPQIPEPGGPTMLPGLQQYPPLAADEPWVFGYDYSPATGTWRLRADTSAVP